MRKLLCLVLLAGVLLGGVSCRAYREYTIENNKLGAQGFYENEDVRNYTVENDKVGAQFFYYDRESREQCDKVQDFIGPKSVYY